MTIDSAFYDKNVKVKNWCRIFTNCHLSNARKQLRKTIKLWYASVAVLTIQCSVGGRYSDHY